jgi:arsenate reductase (glutaredoxin)
VTLTLFHNPACGTSRKVLAAVTDRGISVAVVEYLKHPLSAADLRDLTGRLDGDVADLVRKDPYFKELGLDPDDYTTTAAVVDLLVEHPRLMQRPLLDDGTTVVIARPVEAAEAFLDGAASPASGT